jgi:rhodanese-related sulfurtransferase
MGLITKTLEQAQQRGQQNNLPYSGALTPAEASLLLSNAPGAKIVDVRCKAELDWVGRIPGAVEIEWATYPGMKPNPNFLAALEQQLDKEAMVMFICRSGARSNQAATIAAQAGFTEVYNVLDGFEGDRDANGHRSVTTGWRAANLPWQQS